MKKINQIERVISILGFLANGDKLTAKIVEHRFCYKASRRDISRDFLHILDAGIPIDYEIKGREKIYFFNPGYQARLAPLFKNRKAA